MFFPFLGRSCSKPLYIIYLFLPHFFPASCFLFFRAAFPRHPGSVLHSRSAPAIAAYCLGPLSQDFVNSYTMKKYVNLFTLTIFVVAIFSCTKSNRNIKVFQELDRCTLEPVYYADQRSWGEYPHVEMAYKDSSLSAIKYWVDDSTFFIEKFTEDFNGYKHSRTILPDHKNIYYEAERYYIKDTCVSIYRFGTDNDSNLHTTDRVQINYGNTEIAFSFIPDDQEFGGVDEIFEMKLPIKKFLKKNKVCERANGAMVDRYKDEDTILKRTSYLYLPWLKSYAKREEYFDKNVAKSINWLQYLGHTQKRIYLRMTDPVKLKTSYIVKRRKKYFPLITCDYHN
jgi:hypothetical protein